MEEKIKTENNSLSKKKEGKQKKKKKKKGNERKKCGKERKLMNMTSWRNACGRKQIRQENKKQKSGKK